MQELYYRHHCDSSWPPHRQICCCDGMILHRARMMLRFKIEDRLLQVYFLQVGSEKKNLLGVFFFYTNILFSTLSLQKGIYQKRIKAEKKNGA